MKKVLLVLDNPHREMRGMVAIWMRLRKKGIAAHIVSKTCFNDWYRIMLPNAVVVPRMTPDFSRFLKRVAHETEIIVIPSEHGSGFENKVVSNIFGPNFGSRGERMNGPELATFILVGGENQASWIAAADPTLASKIRVVGTLSSDHWFKPKRAGQLRDEVGICTTFKSLLMSSSTRSVHKSWYDHLSPGYADNRWRLTLQNLEFHYLAKLFEATDLMLDRGLKVHIRPHPHEYWRGWTIWQKHAKPAAAINRQVDLAGWIDSKMVCITSFSTTSIDCIARGVPAISLENLVADEVALMPKIKEPMKGDFAWKVSSIDELFGAIDRARRGELPCSPNLDEARTFMAGNFCWPRDKSCATMCADAIDEALRTSTKQRQRAISDVLAVPRAIAKILAKDLRDVIGPRRSNLLFAASIKLWMDAYRFNRDITC